MSPTAGRSGDPASAWAWACKQRCGVPADLRQPPRGQPGADDPGRQAVGDHGLAVRAEGQQRQGSQLVQRRVDLCGRQAPAQDARLGGGVQQVPGHPGPGQHRDELHDPVASRQAGPLPGTAAPPAPRRLGRLRFAVPASGPGTRRIEVIPAIRAAARASASGRCEFATLRLPRHPSGRCAGQEIERLLRREHSYLDGRSQV